jgi:hypothetical protein
MHSVGQQIDVEAPICDVIDQMVTWQTLSVLVTEKGRPVGLIRLSDLCDAVMKQIRQTAGNSDSEV